MPAPVYPDCRPFALALTSAILTPIATGLGAFASAYTKTMSPINVNVPPPVPETKTEAKTETETKDPKPVETDETVTKLKEEEAKRQEQDEKEEKERALVEEGKIEELKKTAKTDEEMAAVEKLETAEAARKEEFRTAQEKKRQAALLAICKAGEQAAKGLSDMGLARAKAAESYRQQKMEFLKEKLKIQEEERKNLVNMAEYATRMTQAADAKGSRRTSSSRCRRRSGRCAASASSCGTTRSSGRRWLPPVKSSAARKPRGFGATSTATRGSPSACASPLVAMWRSTNSSIGSPRTGIRRRTSGRTPDRRLS